MPGKLVFTGGHHSSSLVVAQKLRDDGWEIIWLGHRHSMWTDESDSAEYKDVAAAGIKFYDLIAGKFHRTYNPLKLVRIPIGFAHAFLLLLVIKPSGIVSFGGYLAVPTVIAGKLLGIPSITHEQTAVAGWANWLISRFVKKIALTWETSSKLYPTHKSVVVGLPVRDEILAIKPQKPNNKPVIYITGGKQGSHTINEAVFQSLPRLLEQYDVIHQTGSSTLYMDFANAKEKQTPGYQVFDYSAKKSVEALTMADVVIGRAGAHTIYELGILGKKAVLIPIPWVSHQEQDKNSLILVHAGNAILLPEKNLTADSLILAVSQALKLSATPLNFPRDAADKMKQLIVQELT